MNTEKKEHRNDDYYRLAGYWKTKKAEEYDRSIEYDTVSEFEVVYKPGVAYFIVD